ncbi:hypothetical protein G8O24_13405 [Bradyrhizobium sp. INPA01-394B]|uniref:Uncharacterized protein n=1 Tax=Bradyrhizobium campsiandrae TaxID=1729892 RepID=A0ABR7UEB5_9BRAD|nr:hypothetical protein [Bradyrhizobium campsiandrae]MBC9878339.1 hypothetical protein [Bradyrhizobium campsiandrae]MBC9982421.1 hypothetical protein [Bradyrhizobium campsiandrae]
MAAEGTPAASASASAPSTPLNDFRNQLGDVRKSLEGVNARIEEKARTIESLSKPDAAKQQVEELQALISQTLSLVADNGEIARLGARALEYARSKQEQMRNDTKFTPAERSALQKRWDQNVAEMVKATDELAKASGEFAQLLKTVQTRRDYAAEVLEVENADEMVRVVRNLAGEVRGASEGLKLFIRSLTPPES